MSIDDRLPEEPRTGQGPGGKDWLFGLAVTVLFATDLAYLKNLEGVQTAVRYYSQTPGVAAVHAIGFTVDLLVLATMAWWFVRPFRRYGPETILASLAAAGILACWAELLIALKALHGAVYRLDDLPFRPINNWGLIGVAVFGLYLVAKTDMRRLFGRGAFWAKVAVMVCLTGAQWMLFATVRAKVGV
ncbi:MAG: hypothetical protein JSS65_11575 [Armatimonadetes bacterium]|nr:hypothetical protein [Armatimonadota bacterium]